MLTFTVIFLQIFNATEEMKDAVNYPNIRVFIAAEKESTTPLNDLAEGGIFQPWSLPGMITQLIHAFPGNSIKYYN